MPRWASWQAIGGAKVHRTSSNAGAPVRRVGQIEYGLSTQGHATGIAPTGLERRGIVLTRHTRYLRRASSPIGAVMNYASRSTRLFGQLLDGAIGAAPFLIGVFLGFIGIPFA